MKSQTPEMARFHDALRSVMTVTKPELTALLHDRKALEAVRQRKGPKPSASAHISLGTIWSHVDALFA